MSKKSHIFTCSICFFLFSIITLMPLVSAQDEIVQPDKAVLSQDSIRVSALPPTSVIAVDHKYDAGDAIDISWVPSIDDRLTDGKVIGYKVYRHTDGAEPELLFQLAPGANNFSDNSVTTDGSYRYTVASVTVDAEFASTMTEAVTPEVEWFNKDKKYLLMIALIVLGAIIFFIEYARRGKKLFVRKIAGIEAVDEAVGRATEMGRPILFIPGIQDMDDVQTLAGLTILGRIAKTIAEYDTKLFMPVSRSLVMTAARETIKASFQMAGRPDQYNDDIVTYITDEQFGYVASVNGLMVREKPATVFLLGAFFAESLILAETGNSIGAIQIAGTARAAQIPFFIAACDFTLIGEELFAASAYLSNEPRALGSLKGQDVGKALAMAIIVIGAIAATAAAAWQFESMHWLEQGLRNIFSTK